MSERRRRRRHAEGISLRLEIPAGESFVRASRSGMPVVETRGQHK